MIYRKVFCLLCVSLSLGCSTAVTAEPPAPTLSTFGWVEPVSLQPADILLHAKLDTGADNCSVHAEDLKLFTKNDADWVRFTTANRYGQRKQIERRVIRTAKIKTKRGNVQKRPVVRIGMCLGSIFETIECNLVDRSHFTYPVLIGRNFLAGSAIVNSSVTYTSAPNCKRPPKKNKKKK